MVSAEGPAAPLLGWGFRNHRAPRNQHGQRRDARADPGCRAQTRLHVHPSAPRWVGGAGWTNTRDSAPSGVAPGAGPRVLGAVSPVEPAAKVTVRVRKHSGRGLASLAPTGHTGTPRNCRAGGPARGPVAAGRVNLNSDLRLSLCAAPVPRPESRQWPPALGPALPGTAWHPGSAHQHNLQPGTRTPGSADRRCRAPREGRHGPSGRSRGLEWTPGGTFYFKAVKGSEAAGSPPVQETPG